MLHLSKRVSTFFKKKFVYLFNIQISDTFAFQAMKRKAIFLFA